MVDGLTTFPFSSENNNTTNHIPNKLAVTLIISVLLVSLLAERTTAA